MIIGDGYIPYHFRVRVEVTSGQQLARIFRTATGIKEELEGIGRVDGFPGAVIDRLASIPGVVQICPDGAISSVLNPLKMARAFGARPCAMYGVVGTGPIAEAIREDLGRREIAFHPLVRTTADSSIEISMWDAQFRFWGEFQIHFLRMRDRSHIFRLEPAHETAAEAIVFSRVNQSRSEAARRLFCSGRLVSICVGGFTRHVNPEDYLALLANAQHVVLRYPEIRPMSPALQVAFPRNWQADAPTGDLLTFAERLGTCGGGRRLVALVFRRAVYLYTPELGPVVLEVPEAHRPTVPVGEFQGALITRSLALERYLPATVQELEMLGNTALQAAYQVCGRFPLQYPPPTFVPTTTWRV